MSAQASFTISLALAMLGIASTVRGQDDELPPPVSDLVLRTSFDQIEHTPVAPDQVFKEVLSDLRLKQFDQALPRLEYLQGLRQNDADILILRGCVYAESGRPEMAEPIFRYVTKIVPSHPAARLNLAESLLSQKKYAEAETTLTLLSLIRPESEVVRFKLILAELKLKEMPAARAEIDALRDRSKTAAWHFASAAFAFASGDVIKGREWVTKAEDLFPREQTAYFYKSLADFGWVTPRKL